MPKITANKRLGRRKKTHRVRQQIETLVNVPESECDEPPLDIQLPPTTVVETFAATVDVPESECNQPPLDIQLPPTTVVETFAATVDVPESECNQPPLDIQFLPTTVVNATYLLLKEKMLPNWYILIVEQGLQLFEISLGTNCYVKFSIFLFNDGTMTISVNQLPLPSDSYLWARCQNLPMLMLQNSAADIAKVISSIVTELATKACPGNFECTYQYLWMDGKYNKAGAIQNKGSPHATFRVFDCAMLANNSKCKKCLAFRHALQSQHSRVMLKDNDTSRPGSSCSWSSSSQSMSRPNSSMSVDSMKQKLTHFAKKIKQLGSKVAYRDKRIDALIKQDGVRVGGSMNGELSSILDDNFNNLTDFQKIFWEQQQKAANVKNKRGMRWHPLMIRLALRVRMLSNTAYEALKESGAIALPSQRTLYDYTHHMTATEGCQRQVLQGIVDKLDKCSVPSEKRLFSLMFDEMNVKNNLVFKASSGEFVGYVKLDELEGEFLKMSDMLDAKKGPSQPQLAKKVLAYMIQCLGSKLKEIVAVFSTVDLNASQIYVRTWEVIFNLELSGMKILCLVCDGAGSNRKFFQMHKPITPGRLVFDTINVASEDRRPLFFISDPPHLIKTWRNCFSNSYAHRRSRKLWFNGDISWHLITKLFEGSKGDTLRYAHKLTANHVYLNSFSCMKVKYAAQVLSETTASALELTYKDTQLEINPTVKFIRMANSFFDILNGSHTRQGKHSRNPNLDPYTSVDDPRFDFMQDTVLKYFEDWRLAVMTREGNHSARDREKMMLSKQTIDGIYITLNGFSGAVRYALSHGIKFINARILNQDALEQYFGKQRSSGGSNNNPDLNQFLQNTIALRLQGDLASASKRGNTETREKGINLTDGPLAKRKVVRKKKSVRIQQT